MQSKDTLSVVEMNAGDEVAFTLVSGRTVRIQMLESSSEIVFTTLEELKKGGPREGSVYLIHCRLNIDGQEMELVRYVPVQQSYYEPWTVNGLNIWFDGVRSLSELFNENHGDCLPTKEVRFALQDADRSICPEDIGNWVPIPEQRLLVEKAYGGEDTWMGTYFGADLHGGLDLNVLSNTRLYAPIAFDEQFYFNSLKAGDNNNRWRGIREWKNGDIWHLQSHHLVEALVDEHTALEKGTAYATGGGVWAGYTSHLHFAFRVIQPGHEMYHVDPWILFWQIFKNNREKAQGIKAVMAPLAPGETGQPLTFSSAGSRPGIWGGELTWYWDFGDGNVSLDPHPTHVFREPGIYPVTLYLSDGSERAALTQHLTINGTSVSVDSLLLESTEAHRFQRTPPWKTLIHGAAVNLMINSVIFHRYDWQEGPYVPVEVNLRMAGNLLKDSALPPCTIEISYLHGADRDWLELETEETPRGLRLVLQPVHGKLIRKSGFYEAVVHVGHADAVNGPLAIHVYVDVQFSKPIAEQSVTHSGPHAEVSPYYWLAPRMHQEWNRSTSKTFLVGGGRRPGETVRFRPTLMAGNYEVALAGEAYQSPELLDRTGRFKVRVVHAGGETTVLADPAQSLSLGSYSFDTGRGGYAEILSDDAEGLILVDAVRFSKLSEPGDD